MAVINCSDIFHALDCPQQFSEVQSLRCDMLNSKTVGFWWWKTLTNMVYVWYLGLKICQWSKLRHCNVNIKKIMSKIKLYGNECIEIKACNIQTWHNIQCCWYTSRNSAMLYEKQNLLIYKLYEHNSTLSKTHVDKSL